VSRWFNFACSAAISLIPAVQMTKLAGGGSLPCSRRFRPMQRQVPVFPPSKIGHGAPASRVPAVPAGGNFAMFANFAVSQNKKSSPQGL
jgi:hypothetical protein